MVSDEMKRRAMAKLVAPMGKEELVVLKKYVELLNEIDDEDAWGVFKRMIVDSSNHLRLDTEMLLKLAPGAQKPRVSKKEVQKDLERLLKELDVAEKLELAAQRMYERALPDLEDPYLRGTAAWIRDEEVKHVKLVQDLRERTKKKLARM